MAMTDAERRRRCDEKQQMNGFVRKCVWVRKEHVQKLLDLVKWSKKSKETNKND